MLRSVIEPFVKKVANEYSEKEIKSLIEKVRKVPIKEIISDPDRINLRRIRLNEAEIMPSATAVERILGKNDLVDINYLHRAFNASRAVCRVVLRRGLRVVGYATGFMISPNVMMTNYHVIESVSDARKYLIEFNYELDNFGREQRTTKFQLDPDKLFFSNKEYDVAIVAVNPVPFEGTDSLSSFGFLQLVDDIGKINVKEFVTIIQHPGGQPKQIALRENQLLEIDDKDLLYQSDTAQGSSGSPVFNDSWQIVALHYAGVPRTNKNGDWLTKDNDIALANTPEDEIDWIANKGIRASKLVKLIKEEVQDSALKEEIIRVFDGELLPNFTPIVISKAVDETIDLKEEKPNVNPVKTHQCSNLQIIPKQGGADITLPLTFSLTVNNQSIEFQKNADDNLNSNNLPKLEAYKIPYIDEDYTNRRGYDPNFLGIEVPNLSVYNSSNISKIEGDIYIPYKHFSVVLNKNRKIALFTSSNVDAREEFKKPEKDKKYNRKALAGFGKNDIEKWKTDPRIPVEDQLTDIFYKKDRGAFDKGHLVRRDDVAWGDSYDEVRKANGDTFHVTNCSPQVKGFNRSNLGGVWGKFENEVLEQAEQEKLIVFSGPLLTDEDKYFQGVGFNKEEVEIQIPSSFWKVIVCRVGNELKTFGFLFEQDLSHVDLEFAVPAEWKNAQISIEDLAQITTNIRFPRILIETDAINS